ncbi:fimbrial biogenesis chaperone [Stenotrophomonas sepilia]|uniref:fimbrial biogenesis chaperone n=1 Tax=Stenotrophomonas sepilia TaxID=2860290 RepID=UPI00333FF70C
MRVIQYIVGVCALLAAWSSRADIGVEHTRIVHSDQHTLMIRVWNRGERDSLIQSWVDDGNKAEALEHVKVPYVVTAPLLRLGKGRNRDLVIKALSTAQLPQDRESVFWLNILDVPARELGASEELRLDYAVNWRVKLFHRPSGLQGSPASSAERLQWRVKRDESGGARLVAANTSPLHVSLSSVRVNGVGLELTPQSALVRPFSEWEGKMDGVPPESMEVEVHWVDDEGKAQLHKTVVR